MYVSNEAEKAFEKLEDRLHYFELATNSLLKGLEIEVDIHEEGNWKTAKVLSVKPFQRFGESDAMMFLDNDLPPIQVMWGKDKVWRLKNQ